MIRPFTWYNTFDLVTLTIYLPLILNPCWGPQNSLPSSTDKGLLVFKNILIKILKQCKNKQFKGLRIKLIKIPNTKMPGLRIYI